MIRLTKLGKKTFDTIDIPSSLEMHIMEMMYGRGQCNILDVIDGVRVNYEEYKFNDPKVFTKAIGKLITDALVEIVD